MVFGHGNVARPVPQRAAVGAVHHDGGLRVRLVSISRIEELDCRIGLLIACWFGGGRRLGRRPILKASLLENWLTILWHALKRRWRWRRHATFGAGWRRL